nr:MAG TPA: hypothetical protein [Caudoviricetes sp.]
MKNKRTNQPPIDALSLTGYRGHVDTRGGDSPQVAPRLGAFIEGL